MSRTLGIILAAGTSSRLYPATLVSTKQLLPIYDKPLIYYPLTTLMLAGIRDFLIITTPKEKFLFEELFYDAETTLGIRVDFAEQKFALGIADAFNIVEPYYWKIFDRYALILGDNIFYGSAMTEMLQQANEESEDAVIFVTKVKDPERFGVVEVDELGFAISLEEKPSVPKSNLAVTGLYFFPPCVLEMVKRLKPSVRNELEITDLNQIYLEKKKLRVIQLLRGMVWFDTGTPDSLMEAATLVQNLQKHQGYIIGSPHEIAYSRGWIDRASIVTTGFLCAKSAYGKYLLELAEELAEGKEDE